MRKGRRESGGTAHEDDERVYRESEKVVMSQLPGTEIVSTVETFKGRFLHDCGGMSTVLCFEKIV